MTKTKFNVFINLFFLFFNLDVYGFPTEEKVVQSVVSVNGDIITNYDIAIRSNIIKQILNNSHETNKAYTARYNSGNIRKNIIDDLIKEKLKIAEARRYGIDATDTDIKQGIMITASKFGMEAKQLENILSEVGCQKDIWIHNKVNICYQLFFADIVWARFSGMFFSSQLTNMDKEIDDEVKRYTDYVNFVVNDLSISQIILRTKQNAEDIYNKIKHNKDCKAFNNEIKNGLPGSGSLGFIKLHETTKVVGEHIKDLPIGIVSEPLKNIDNNYYLYIICDKKIDKNLEKKLVPIPEMKARISNAVINNKLEAFAKKYLDRLFNSALIEYM